MEKINPPNGRKKLQAQFTTYKISINCHFAPKEKRLRSQKKDPSIRFEYKME